MVKILFLLLLSLSALQALTCKYDSRLPYQNCAEYIDLLADSDGLMHIDDIVNRDDLWHHPKKTSLGYVNGNVWSRLTLQSSEAAHILLINPKSNINTIDAYVYCNAEASGVHLMGNSKDPNNRLIASKYTHFALDLDAQTSCTVYTRYASRSVIDVSYFITTQPFFLKFIMYETIMWGIFIGLVLTLIIYGMTLFYLLKESVYVVYVSHVVFALLFQLSTHGILYQFGLYGASAIYNTISWLTAYGGVLSILLFSVLFFNTKETMPAVHRLLQLFVLLTALQVLLFIPALFAADIVIYFRSYTKLFIIFELLALLVVGVLAVYRKLSGAKLYLTGHGFFIVMLIYQQINGVINVDISLINVYGTSLGFLVEVIFLSLALNKKVETIKKEKERAERLLAMQSGFASIGKTIGNISHQMKVPIVHLGTLLTRMESILRHREYDASALEATKNKMRETLKFMSGSIRELSTFYAHADKVSVYSPADEIHHVIEMFSAKSAYVEAVIERDLDDSIVLEGYKNAFSNVIVILVDNALDIFKERQLRHGRVSIRAARDHDRCIIEVRDTGGGITLSPPQQVFELFVSSRAQGSGMGLAMAKLLVEERLKGTLRVHNSFEGAVFELRIPLVNVTCNVQK